MKPDIVAVDEDDGRGGKWHIATDGVTGGGGALTLCGWTDVIHSAAPHGQKATCRTCKAIVTFCKKLDMEDT